MVPLYRQRSKTDVPTGKVAPGGLVVRTVTMPGGILLAVLEVRLKRWIELPDVVGEAEILCDRRRPQRLPEDPGKLGDAPEMRNEWLPLPCSAARVCDGLGGVRARAPLLVGTRLQVAACAALS